MPTIRVAVPEDLAELLDAERSLLGFESRESYVRWILENRGAIDGENDGGLAAYAARERNPDRDRSDGDGPVDVEGAADDGATGDGHGPVDGTRPADGAPTPDAASEERDAGTVEVNGRPRAVRISDDPVTEVADELTGVHGDRLDEVARRAVSKTRRRLGDGAGTGLSYRSTTAIRNDGTRPGADITDLDALDVPGRDDDLIDRRREAVGAALAHLRDIGRAKRTDFVSELYDRYTAGYRSEESWWECVKHGLRQVDRVDGAGEGSRTWRYRDYRGRVRVLDD